jgi:hypothetical protein
MLLSAAFLDELLRCQSLHERLRAIRDECSSVNPGT